MKIILGIGLLMENFHAVGEQMNRYPVKSILKKNPDPADSNSIQLKDIGITRETPGEIVLTTYYPDGKAHSSVIGVRASNKSKIFLKIFIDTKTFRNISETKAAVINVTRNAELLTNIALKDLLKFNERRLNFESSRFVNAPRLVDADAYVEIEVKDIRVSTLSDEIGTSKVAQIRANVKNIEVRNQKIHPFRRSELYLIESAVLATRVMEALRRGKRVIARKFLARLNDIRKECERIAPKSKDSHLITRIVNSLKNLGGTNS